MSTDRLTVDRTLIAELLADLAGAATALRHLVRAEKDGVSGEGVKRIASRFLELHARIVEDVYGVKGKAS